VLRACLESRVCSEHLAITNIVLFVAGGYTKRRVPWSQLQEAQEVLAAVARGSSRSREARVASGEGEPEETLDDH
jgi:hypothetical protein